VNIFFGLLKVLKFPLKLLFRRKINKNTLSERLKRSELEQKCYRHVRLNAPSNVSYQKSIGKDKRKRKKKGTFSRKKTNNSKG